MRIRCLLVSTWLLVFSLAQAQSDTTVLSYQEYLANILKYHPLAKQAALQLDLAKAEWLAAKGNLDPMLSSNWNQKNFDDKLYYRQFQGKLQIPTPLGIDVVGGYENTEGVFLNPENTTDPFGLWNAGIEVNLLQGLWVNERRTALEQARVFQNMAENKRQILLNELLYEASYAYLEWQKYFSFQTVINENITLATAYFNNTKISFANGEKTAIDTLEALIILQDAQALLQSNEAGLLKSRQNLENFLWFNDLPLVLQPGTTPQDYVETIFVVDNTQPIASLVNTHPALLEKRNKQSYLEVEQRLKREKLKPKLKAKYNPLLATSDNGLAPTYSSSDYKWGFDFSMPLFLRSERAAIQQGQVKLNELQFDIDNKQNELLNKIENSRQQQRILQEQLALQEQNVAGYRRLLEGENEKFRFGESSVFLVNKRQEKYINGRLKVIALQIKIQLELLNYLYYTNRLLTN